MSYAWDEWLEFAQEGERWVETESSHVAVLTARAMHAARELASSLMDNVESYLSDEEVQAATDVVNAVSLDDAAILTAAQQAAPAPAPAPAPASAPASAPAPAPENN